VGGAQKEDRGKGKFLFQAAKRFLLEGYVRALVVKRKRKKRDGRRSTEGPID